SSPPAGWTSAPPRSRRRRSPCWPRSSPSAPAARASRCARPRGRSATPTRSRTRKRRTAVVVGSGIAGLATTYELARRDVDVLNVGDGRPAQSAGLGRIFRIAHRDPHLCALALEAHARWREWEADFGAGTLLGDEGLVVTRRGCAAATRAARAPLQELSGAQIRARLPPLAPGHPWDEAILDPLGGSLR